MKDLNYFQKREKQIKEQLDEAYRQKNREKLAEAAKSLIMLAEELVKK